MWRHWLVLLPSVVIVLIPFPEILAAQEFTELRKLLADDAAIFDRFGDSVALSGDTAIIGSSSDDAGTDSGAAYVFERDQGGQDNWGLVTKLTAPTAAAFDGFGTSVAIEGDTIVVGAAFADDGALNSGSAYVFGRNQDGPNSWGHVSTLTASDASNPNRFGGSVVLSGDTIVVGAVNDDDGCSVDPDCNSGAAYVFKQDQGGSNNWGQVAKITAENAAAGDRFGEAIAIDGDTIVVGARFADTGAGAAYIFERDQGGLDNWGQFIELTDFSISFSQALFGSSLAIDGDIVVVGAATNSAGIGTSGRAFVFGRNQGDPNNWGRIRTLIASDGSVRDEFGISVAIDSDTIVVGARSTDENGSGSGSAYVFKQDQGGPNNWGEVEKLTASDAATFDAFGDAIAFNGDVIVVGAVTDDDACPTDPNCDSGSAYIFGRPTTPPPGTGPTLSIPAVIPGSANSPVSVPIIFTSNGQNITATTFSIDYDETCLDFDPTDSSSDGIPDTVSFTLPGDFAPAVTFAAADTLGELDFTIADFSAPLATLQDGVIATITFTPICVPTDTSIIAPVNFGLTPAASFGDTAGQSVPGTTVNGSVEILPGMPGDCNDDGVIDAGDISACVLEVFDGDGNVWTDVAGGTFLGSPVGCDANQDFLVDAGDFSCKILLIFNGAGSCAPPLPPTTRSAAGPELRLGQAASHDSGKTVTIPLSFTGNGHAIVTSAFNVDYDETCLSFDPSTGLAFTLPAGITPSASFDAADTAGELDISFFDPALPFATLPDGPVATLTFTTLCDSGTGTIKSAVGFGTEPALSFGNTSGQSVPGTGLGGGVVIMSPLFADGFESGGISRWSGEVP